MGRAHHTPESNALWEVAAALPLNQTLTYRLPPELAGRAQVGSPALVPVGRRVVTGYLLGPAREVPPVAIKDIRRILDEVPRFGREMVELFRWAADYYQYPLGEALGQIIPGGSRISNPRQETWAAASELPEGAAPPQRLGPKAQALWERLRDSGPSPVKELAIPFPGCRPILKRLAARGLVRLEPRPAWRDPLEGHFLESEEPLTLAPDQQKARAALVQGIKSGKFSPFLLHGVTASGKTEVYLTAAAAVLARNRQVLVLLPEIALAHPVGLAFRRRFGERVTVLHSGLSQAARLDQWRRIVLGQVDVVVGARSAVFAPLPRPGLIVVDEEHDPSYKQEGGFLYQARDVALYRGKLAQATVVLVSATPQVSTFHRAQERQYRYVNLARRVTPQAVPEVHLVDLRRRRDKDERIISRPLAQSLEEVLTRGEQALLFLNRRGYSRVLFCLFCGHVFQCRSCSVALTHHQVWGRLVCHYCGYGQEAPERCPQCTSVAVKHYGVGTERVEAEVRRLLPAARVARLDRDTAPHSGRAVEVFDRFAAGDLDILVGTQMITKGHHFPRVTLVGAMEADLSLFFPEYHAGERTFQLLAQVAGRAGRGQARGRVLIQTRHPEHYVFQAVKTLDYEGFYRQEIEVRRLAGYPPFTRLALARLSGLSEDGVKREAKRVVESLQYEVSRNQDLAARVRILGPAPAGLARLKGRYRWQILLKSYGRGPLARTLEHLRRLWSPPRRSRIDLSVDIDPASLF
ncbi:MAG: primosomal protein N' [Deltaproteobacteria bacterium]|nr:primosomal protein N' [Deltaproteobacteria bacterium]